MSSVKDRAHVFNTPPSGDVLKSIPVEKTGVSIKDKISTFNEEKLSVPAKSDKTAYSVSDQVNAFSATSQSENSSESSVSSKIKAFQKNDPGPIETNVSKMAKSAESRIAAESSKVAETAKKFEVKEAVNVVSGQPKKGEPEKNVVSSPPVISSLDQTKLLVMIGAVSCLAIGILALAIKSSQKK